MRWLSLLAAGAATMFAPLAFAQLAAPNDAGVSVGHVHLTVPDPDAQITWGELAREVAHVAAGLRELGVERGDRVVAYMPNLPETLVAFLATASIGAIFSRNSTLVHSSSRTGVA